jgi:hypothetical protein
VINQPTRAASRMTKSKLGHITTRPAYFVGFS